MSRIINLILFLLLLIIPPLGFIVAAPFLFPTESKQILAQVAQKVPALQDLLLKYHLIDDKHEMSSSEDEDSPDSNDINSKFLLKKETPFNKEFYQVICGDDKLSTEISKFTGCSGCPSYTESEDKKATLSLKLFVRGYFSQVTSKESLFFLEGCTKDPSKYQHAVLLKQTSDSWSRQGVFIISKFSEDPIIFSQKEKVSQIVTKTKSVDGPSIEEIILAFNFKGNKLSTDHLFNAKYNRGVNCNNILGTSVSQPIKTSNTQLEFNLDLMEQFQNKSLCENTPAFKRKFYIKPSSYKITYNFNGDEFQAEEKSQFILNNVDKTFEGDL